MEMKMFFPLLLLLVCSVSTAELQAQSDNNILSHVRQSEGQVGEAESLTEQQTCTQYINAVLRKMSAWVAALKVDVQHLQRDNEVKTMGLKFLNQRYQAQETQVKRLQNQNQVQESHVKELQKKNQVQAAELAAVKVKANITENQVEALKREGEAQETQIKELQDQNQAQAAELAAVKVNAENQVEALKREGEAQATELAAVKVKANITGNQLEDLEREGEAKRLSFSASLVTSGQGHTGPFNTTITLIFRNVFTNIGNAYNPNTGLFTAPVRGVYHFEFHIQGGGSSTNPASAELVKNGEQICASWTHQAAGGHKASNGVSLLLEIGDVVFLRMWANSWVYDSTSHHTTFSGYLLFTI